MPSYEHENTRHPQYSAENLNRADGRAGFSGDDNERLWRIGTWAATRFNNYTEKLPFNPTEEVWNYVASWDDQKLNYIAAIHETLADQPAPSGATAYPNIPTAAGQEAIQRPLEQFAGQDADPSSWGALFFVNQVTEDSHSGGITRDIGNTLRVIDLFRERHDELNIRTCYTTYSSPPNMGTIRADVWDILLYDLVQQAEPIYNNAIGISGDADPYVISADYISSLQYAAAEYPLADILATYIAWYREGDPHSDVNRVVGYWEFLRSERQKIIGRFPISESSMAVRLGSYAAVGGFNRLLPTREAIELHQRILTARREPEENTPYARFVEGPYVATDSRRLYAAIAMGYGPHQSWDVENMPFRTGIDPIRIADSSALSQVALDPNTLRNIVLEMEGIYLERLNPTQAADLRNRGRAYFQFEV